MCFKVCVCGGEVTPREMYHKERILFVYRLSVVLYPGGGFTYF